MIWTGQIYTKRLEKKQSAMETVALEKAAEQPVKKHVLEIMTNPVTLMTDVMETIQQSKTKTIKGE